MDWVRVLLGLLLLLGRVHGGEVSYDGRSLIINANRNIFFSGSIHYPRSTPQMWPSLIGKAKEGGIDVIDTYVFWNVHEPQPGQYNFEGRYDLVSFLKQVHAQGLYVILRIGPFIESEWRYGYFTTKSSQYQLFNGIFSNTLLPYNNYGVFLLGTNYAHAETTYNICNSGLPFWLHDVPGITFRTDNEQYKHYMQNFTSKIVNMLKDENLYASQGGPVILSQIENEYANVEGAFGDAGPRYVKWAAEMAVGLNTGVPWTMCKQDDAPDPVINTCNGLNCGETFKGPNSPNKPAMWTENWTQQYEVFGENPHRRSPKDIAYAVVLFIAKNKGCFVNYYMYHGGTNFGRWGSAFAKTSYYDDAPLDEYGLIQQPKWGHLKDLHAAIKSVSKTLLTGNLSQESLGENQTAYVYEDNSGNCVAFLSNSHPVHSATVNFRSRPYKLSKRSISILPDCKYVAFNTANVNAPTSSRSLRLRQNFSPDDGWEQFTEVIPSFDDSSLKSDNLLDQMSTTKDETDYLWYTFRYNSEEKDQPGLRVKSSAHVLHVFVNGAYSGSAQGSHGSKSFVFENPISVEAGENNISMLSVMFGLPDSGAHMERKTAKVDSVDIGKGHRTYGYKVGLIGEQLFLSHASSNASWEILSSQSNLQRLVWYKTSFSTPDGDDSLVLDLSSMGKGEAWVNGDSIGRYWVSLHDSQGNPSQTLYHVPREFLQSTDNKLVIFEEMGGDPTKISLKSISTDRAFGHFSVNIHRRLGSSFLQLKCPSGRRVSAVEFASYGNPTANFGSYAVGSCHSTNSKSVVEKACVGKESCSLSLSTMSFGGDPCPGTTKSLLVDATCI